MEYRVIELLQEIKSLLTGKPKKEKWMDIKDASRYCGIGVQTLRRNIINKKDPSKGGQLKASTTTGKLLFRQADLCAWLDNNA